MFDLFTHVYAMERKANGEPVWISPEKDPEGMEAARERAKAQPIDGERYAYFVRAEENPHLTFLDYDTKNGKRGAEQYAQHAEAYPEFAQTLRHTTKTPGAMRVIFKRIEDNTDAHPYGGTEWGDALEVFDAGTTKGRWIAIPPSRRYGDWEGTEPVEAPQALRDEFKAAARSRSTPSATATPTGWLEDVWKPRTLATLPEHTTYSLSTDKAGRRKTDSLCDCGPFYRKSDGERIAVTRHGEFARFTKSILNPFVAKGAQVGPTELNRVFTLIDHYNDLWQCANCAPKFADQRAIVRDIERVASGMPGIRWWSTSTDYKPAEWLVEGMFEVEPHETLIVGPKGYGKSHFATHLAKEFEKASGKRAVYLSFDEHASDIHKRHPGAIVFSFKDSGTKGTAAEYVWQSPDYRTVLERAVDSSGLSEGVLIIEPWTRFYKGLCNPKTTDDYDKAYEAVGALHEIAPGFHSLLAAHTAKGKGSEDHGAEAVLGTVGLAGSTRFGYNVYKQGKQRVISCWGNNQDENKKWLPILVDEPGKPYEFRLDPYETLNLIKATQEIILKGKTAHKPNLREALQMEHQMTFKVEGAYIVPCQPDDSEGLKANTWGSASDIAKDGDAA